MSYILDALKKAERQRSLGQVPTLETNYADGTARRRRVWPWTWAAVLAVNGILLALILRHPENPPSAPQTVAAPQPVATHQPVAAPKPSTGGRPGSPAILAVNEHAAVPAPIVRAPTQTAVQDRPAAVPVTPMPASLDPAAPVVMQAASPVTPAAAPPAQTPSGRVENRAAPAVQKSTVQPIHRPPAAASHSSPPVRLSQQQGHAAVPAAHAAMRAPVATPAPAAAPPAPPLPSKPSPSRPAPAAPPPELAPAVAAAPTAQPSAGATPAAGADAASAEVSAAPPGPTVIPLLRDLPFEFQKSVPPVRIDAMVYSEDQQARMAFLNGHKYREGQQLEGTNLHVESILRQGVVLSLGGQRFLLTP